MNSRKFKISMHLMRFDNTYKSVKRFKISPLHNKTTLAQPRQRKHRIMIDFLSNSPFFYFFVAPKFHKLWSQTLQLRFSTKNLSYWPHSKNKDRNEEKSNCWPYLSTFHYLLTSVPVTIKNRESTKIKLSEIICGNGLKEICC